MKKLFKFLAYPVGFLCIILIMYSGAVSDFFSGLADSNGGIALSLYNKVMSYFTHATAWNIIFLLMFFSFTVVFIVVLDIQVKRIFKKLNWKLYTPIKAVLVYGLYAFIFIVGANGLIIFYGAAKTANTISDIEKPKPTLVLGTSKMLSSGKGVNLYYKHRIDAARTLWDAQKVSYFIVSGDKTKEKSYDETADIKADLLAFGVPEEKVKIDTAGYRTLDSMLRIREMYRTNEVIVISQAFHVPRALFQGLFYGMKPTGWNAAGSSTMAMHVRELFSKPKVLLDLIFFNMQPRVLLADGKAIEHSNEFAVNSDLAVYLLLLLFVVCISSLGIAFKYFDADGNSHKTNVA